jgi:hypothetical protein
VVPALVQSPYLQNNLSTAERLPPISKFYGKLTPDDVARAIESGIDRRKRCVFIPILFRFTFFAPPRARLVEWWCRWHRR